MNINHLIVVFPYRRTTFWTSGTIADPTGVGNDTKIKWEGEGVYADPTVEEFWRNPTDRTIPPIHIVYQFYGESHTNPHRVPVLW